MMTPKQGQHAYWLDHYGLYGMVPGYAAANAILNTTRIAVPTPANGTQPIAEHCLIWPGPVSRDGYGIWHGEETLAHRAAYAASRQCSIPSNAMVLHLCHRPYCWQPSHLYIRDASRNREDWAAYHSRGSYKTWGALGERWDAAFYGASEHHLDTPDVRLPPVQSLPEMSPPPKACPHTFDVPAGDARLCSGCGESTSASERWARVQAARGGLRWLDEYGDWHEAEQQRRHIRDMTDFSNRSRCTVTGIPNLCRCPARGLPTNAGL